MGESGGTKIPAGETEYASRYNLPWPLVAATFTVQWHAQPLMSLVRPFESLIRADLVARSYFLPSLRSAHRGTHSRAFNGEIALFFSDPFLQAHVGAITGGHTCLWSRILDPSHQPVFAYRREIVEPNQVVSRWVVRFAVGALKNKRHGRFADPIESLSIETLCHRHCEHHWSSFEIRQMGAELLVVLAQWSLQIVGPLVLTDGDLHIPTRITTRATPPKSSVVGFPAWISTLLAW